MKQTDKSASLFDPSLTPQNAHEKGYDYVDDVIYDQLNPDEAIMDVLEFIRKFKGKLGTPQQTNTHEEFFGLYIPLLEADI